MMLLKHLKFAMESVQHWGRRSIWADATLGQTQHWGRRSIWGSRNIGADATLGQHQKLSPFPDSNDNKQVQGKIIIPHVSKKGEHDEPRGNAQQKNYM